MRRKHFWGALLAALAAGAHAQALPSFEATSLTGQTVTEQRLLGQPSILIVTPSRDAATSTRRWVQALQRNVDPDAIRVRDVLAIDLPFFISERDALGRARERIPERYHDQTWLMTEVRLETALGIPPESGVAHVLVLNAQGVPVARVSGTPTQQRIAEVTQAVAQLTQ